MIDLRSDTVTRPSEAMRRAMAAAPVGDDVFEEDPTVQRLEGAVAEILGFEAALFTPSGPMANQIAMRILAPPGTEVLMEERSHPFHFEMAGMAALSGLLPRPIPSPDGILRADAVRAAVQPDVSYKPRSSLLVLENTHNLWGGKVYRRSDIDPLLNAAKQSGLRAHLGGDCEPRRPGRRRCRRAGPRHLGDARRTEALRRVEGDVLGRRRPRRAAGPNEK